MTLPDRSDFMGSMFLGIDMPRRFVLEVLTGDGEWIEHGRFDAASFAREPDGTYISAIGEGSPMHLRCLRQEGSVVHVVDGGGEPYTYRLTPR